MGRRCWQFAIWIMADLRSTAASVSPWRHGESSGVILFSSPSLIISFLFIDFALPAVSVAQGDDY